MQQGNDIPVTCEGRGGCFVQPIERRRHSYNQLGWKSIDIPNRRVLAAGLDTMNHLMYPPPQTEGTKLMHNL